MRLRRLQRHRALDARAAAQLVARLDQERHALRAVDRQRDAHLPLLRGDALHPARHLRVLGLPDHVPGFDQTQVERALVRPAEDQLEQAGRDHVAGVQAAAGLVVLGFALIEEHAVARLQLRRLGLRAHQHLPRPRVHFLDAADQHAAVPRIEAVHQLLVIGPVEEAVREAARVAVAQLLLVARRQRGRAHRPRGVERAAVLVDDVGDVLGALHAALDLETGDAGFEQVGKQVVGRQIARGQEILELLVAARGVAAAVDDQIVGQPAALRALAAVGAAMLQSLAGQALAAPAHAKGAVDEALQLQIGVLCELVDLVDGQLAGQDDARDAEAPGDLRRLG